MNATQTEPVETNAAYDAITREHTAFRCWADMVAAMRAGYVPTVSKRRQSSLVIALEAAGYRAFVVA